jgi:outer membrane beta-barrel protein
MRLPALLGAALCALLFSPSALAQTQFDGLDLSGQSQPPPPPAEESGSAGLDLTEETPPPALPPTLGSEAAKAPESKLREIDLTSEDRVKSVQRRSFLKKGRFDVTPLAFVSLNDAYYAKFGPGARLSYHPHESLGVGLRFMQYNLVPNDNVRLAKRQLQSRMPKVLPNTSLTLDMIWSPFYGKVSVFNAIRHFDLFLIGGAGAIWSQTSVEDGAHLSTHIGVGQRFAFADYLTVEISLLDTLYSDRPDFRTRAVVQQMITLNLGLSLFVPFSSDREH